MLELLLLPVFALLFVLLHFMTGWLFGFAELSPNISLIYLPAFLRMLSVLVLGKFRGTVATLLGGMLLMVFLGTVSTAGLANVFCSAAGPLLALWAFERVSGQAVKLTSLKDLSIVTVAYCVANALIHHAVWLAFDLKELGSGVQVFWMMVGDLNGALLGAYLASRRRDGAPDDALRQAVACGSASTLIAGAGVFDPREFKRQLALTELRELSLR